MRMERYRMVAHGLWAGAGLAAVLLTTVPASAADLPTAPDKQAQALPVPANWQFQATAYGWLTGLNGEIGVRYRQPIPVNVNFTDILNNLKGVFMGAFQAKNDTWMFLVDLVWSKLGANRTLRYGGQLDVEQTLGVAEGYVGLRAPVGSPDLDIRFLAGVRGQRLEADIRHVAVALPLNLSASQSKEWVDPLVGLAIQYQFDKHWFVNATGDIGGFGLGSKLTSQGLLTIGYRWTDNVSTSIGYRVLYTDYQKGGFTYNTTMHGVFLGLGVHF
jgi:hypothetical protein